MSTAMKKEFAKAKKILHPNSRKSIAIGKRAKKISNREKAKMGGLIRQNLTGERMMWIKENMLPDVCPYTPELTAQLLETYIARNDEEMEQITIKRSIGGKRIRQHASREDVIRMTKEREQEEYDTCGLEIPDILITAQCQMLKNWNGELNLLPNFKFRRFGKKHLKEAVQKSNKPAKECKQKPPNSKQKTQADDTKMVQTSTESTVETSSEKKAKCENNEVKEETMDVE